MTSLLCGEPTDERSNALQLVVLSRNDMHLRQALGQQITINLDAGGSKNTTDDVETFVVARVNELQRIEGFDEEMRQNVTKIFLERADKSFLWIGFVMDEISAMTTCTEIYETLESLKTLPKGLDALYDRILLNIPSGRREKAYEILLWVATALRPLRLDELVDLTDIQSVGRINPEQVIRDRITWCGSLLSIRTEPIAPSSSDCNWTHSDHQNNYKVVNLVHHSARDYLLDQNCNKIWTLESHQMNPEIGRACAVQRCLNILQHAHEQNIEWIDCCDSQADPRRLGLLHYAIYRWLDHLKCLPDQEAEIIIQGNNFFSHNSSIATKWFTQYSHPGFAISQTSQPLYVASHVGIASWVQQVLRSAIEHGEDLLNGQDGARSGREIDHAFHCATLHGHEDVMELLLDYGANPAWHGFEALFRLTYQPTQSMLKRLMDCVTDVHAKDSYGKALLMEATKYGTAEAMIVLLKCRRDTMAHINMRDIWENNILHAAVLAAREPEVKLRYLIEQAECKRKDTTSHLSSAQPSTQLAGRRKF
jgi:hypothetical protein